MNVYIGIDPGLDGAAVSIASDDSPSGRRCFRILDTPTLTVEGASGNRREYDLNAMAEWLEEIAKMEANRFALVERVHAMPAQGVRSMFSMGYGVGVWEGLLVGCGIPFERVTPQRWQRAMMDGQGKGKDAARFKAMGLFPEIADMLKRKRDDGRADALLIAEHARRTR